MGDDPCEMSMVSLGSFTLPTENNLAGGGGGSGSAGSVGSVPPSTDPSLSTVSIAGGDGAGVGMLGAEAMTVGTPPMDKAWDLDKITEEPSKGSSGNSKGGRSWWNNPFRKASRQNEESSYVEPVEVSEVSGLNLDPRACTPVGRSGTASTAAGGIGGLDVRRPPAGGVISTEDDLCYAPGSIPSPTSSEALMGFGAEPSPGFSVASYGPTPGWDLEPTSAPATGGSGGSGGGHKWFRPTAGAGTNNVEVTPISAFDRPESP
mmetsp:Transcript_21296/g.46222  ORF Transcript_21296/g.46222 Transcript_21296/m.46222 type:complete len:262 (+) Transcript_21296:448-1233(+)